MVLNGDQIANLLLGQSVGTSLTSVPGMTPEEHTDVENILEPGISNDSFSDTEEQNPDVFGADPSAPREDQDSDPDDVPVDVDTQFNSVFEGLPGYDGEFKKGVSFV